MSPHIKRASAFFIFLSLNAISLRLYDQKSSREKSGEDSASQANIYELKSEFLKE